MYTLVTTTCYYIPRKCRSLLAIGCLMVGSIGLLIALHLTAVVVEREPKMSEKDMIDSIPIRHSLFKEDSRRGGTTHINSMSLTTPTTLNFSLLSPLSSHVATQVNCTPFFPNILFFIRIPKCASTSFVELVKNLTSVTKDPPFSLHFNPSGAFNWNWQTKKQVENYIKIHRQTHNRLLYVRHFYYVPFGGLTNFTYITIVRDPITRLVSSFLYYHFSSRPHIRAMLKPGHKNESLETCINLSHEGCTPNLMTKYFCGHDSPLCDSGSEGALARAKENIEKHFGVIGFVEKLSKTYFLFKRLYPNYFGNLNIRESSIFRRNKNEHSLSLSDRLRRKMEKLNMADMNLYEYLLERFKKQLQQCENNSI